MMNLTSCSKKTGCPVNESVHVKTGKNGQFSKKRGKSNLFPKGMTGDSAIFAFFIKNKRIVDICVNNPFVFVNF